MIMKVKIKEENHLNFYKLNSYDTQIFATLMSNYYYNNLLN